MRAREKEKSNISMDCGIRGVANSYNILKCGCATYKRWTAPAYKEKIEWKSTNDLVEKW